jgi:hypothetical protein
MRRWHRPASPTWHPHGEPPTLPMLIFRLVFGLLLLASVLCFVMFVGTRQDVWRRRGLLVLKWTLIGAAGFFGVLILERLPKLL